MGHSLHRRSRRPGRPPASDAQDSRQALIDAARELFSRRGYDEVSIKTIAARAGLNPAMIGYHFGSKGALLETAFRDALTPVVDQLAALSTSAEAVAPEQRLRRFFELYMRTLAAHPWLPKMMVRHVLPDGGHLQSLAVSLIGSRIGPVIGELVRRDRDEGRLRADLDPLLTTLSIVSLAAFPFVSLPVTERVFGLNPDAQFVERLIDHTTRIFYCGAASHDAA